MGAKNYLQHQIFEDVGVDVEYMNYDVIPWAQNNNAFTPYVSALDLVGNVVPKKRFNHLNPKTISWRKSFLEEGNKMFEKTDKP